MVQTVKKENLIRGLTINEFMDGMIRSGKSEQLFQFLDKYTHSRDVTFALVSNGLSYGIPVDLLFGLVYSESRFNPAALNGHQNKDGSKDYGLMQLNSATYAKYDKDYLMVLSNNVRMGCAHLVEQRDLYKEWIPALVTYNSGSLNTVTAESIMRLSSIIQYSNGLDIDLSSEF